MADTILEQQQQVVELEYGHGVPDPLALTVAAELQAQLPDTEVLLFGSRAIGNWRPESDIDLAAIEMRSKKRSRRCAPSARKSMTAIVRTPSCSTSRV